jgi:hypothetical protein
METYLQTAWGDQWHTVTIDTVKVAIDRLRNMDDEHGAFWVGLIKEDENVLEVHKDLEIIGVFQDKPDVELRGHGQDWDEVVTLFQSFLDDKTEIVKARLETGR